MITMTSMAKKKTTDRHKPNSSIRLPKRLADLLEQLGERNFTTKTAEAVRAVREYLQRNGMLPDDPASGTKS